jgi:uncharacterized membrane-anchored protein YhcB (DUF1043 family)
MTEVEFVKWAMLAMLSVGVFFMKRTLDRIEKEQEDVKKDLQKVKDEYLHKADFKDFKLELRSMFEEIRTDIRSLQK